jgi:cell division GTPase FtsZ
MSDKPAPPSFDGASLKAGDPALNEIAAVIRATTSLVTNEPNLIGFDFADLREGLKDGGNAVFGQGEAAGPPKEGRATRAAEAAIADLKRKLSRKPA